MKGYQKNLLLALASIGATLVILEGVFSLLDLPEPPAPSFLTCNLKAYKKENIPSYYPNQKCYQCYHRKDEIPYSDRSITIDDKRFDCIRYHIGPQGFRTPLFKKKQDDELRIITIGDSFTFGEGAKEKDTFPRLLEEGIGIETVNIAMQGLNTKYERLILEKNIHLRPDFVILGYVLNDTMQHQETIKMVDALEKAARLPRVFCFSRFGSFVYGRVSSFLQSRKVLSDYHDSFKRGWRNSSEQLLAIKDLCHRHGSELLVVLFPVLFKIDDHYTFLELHQEIRNFARQNQFNFMDLLDIYKSHKTSDLWVHELDHHPNALAHKMAYMAIRRWIKENLPHFLSRTSQEEAVMATPSQQR